MKIATAFALLTAGAFALEQPPQEGFRLLEMSGGQRQWFPEEIIDTLAHSLSDPKFHGTPFMDVTDHQDIVPFNSTKAYNYPTSPQQRQLVEGLIDDADIERPRAWLRTLTDFQNRYYTSNSGRDSALYIRDEFQNIIDDSNRDDVTVDTFSHSFLQPSVIGTIRGTDLAEETVVIGAHEDSIAPGMPSGRSPGADDDGSGTVVVMEAFYLLVSSGYRPRRTIEFHTYAGEERGLLGSADIAATYNREGREVHGMLQFDMNGCCSPGSGFNRGTRYNVCTDTQFTSSTLNTFLRMILREYGTLDQGDFRYGYAASDHASWARNGYPAAHVKENVSYPPIHTANDAFNNIDFDYLMNFVNAAVGFGVELGEVA